MINTNKHHSIYDFLSRILNREQLALKLPMFGEIHTQRVFQSTNGVLIGKRPGQERRFMPSVLETTSLIVF